MPICFGTMSDTEREERAREARKVLSRMAPDSTVRAFLRSLSIPASAEDVRAAEAFLLRQGAVRMGVML